MTERSKEELNDLIDKFDISARQRVMFSATAYFDTKDGVEEGTTPDSVYETGQPGEDRPDFDSLAELTFEATINGKQHDNSYLGGSYLDNLNSFLNDVTLIDKFERSANRKAKGQRND